MTEPLTRWPLDRREFLALMIAGAAAPFAAACATPAGPTAGTGQQVPRGQPVRGGTFTDASIGDAASLQPLITSDAPSSAFWGQHYNAPLLRINPDTLELDATYGTAESFTVSPDGQTLTFRLKPNLFWSDGRPLTAQDYQFTQEKMMDPAVNYPFRSLRQQIRTMRATDDRTLVAELAEVFCPALLTVGTTNPIPKHVFENIDINDNPFNLRPQVGSGPFLVREWNRGSFIEFTANERFYLGRPNLDRWVTKIVPNQTVQYSQYKTGEIDTCSPVLPQDWEEAKQLPNTQAFEFYAVPGSWDYIQFNMRLPLFQDLRVRQAFAAATNRQAMIDRVMRGLARPVNSIYTESSWAWNRNIRGVEFNLQRANQLLDEAGWRRPANDPNGIRVNAQGQPLRMRIFYNTGNQIREAVATIVQQSYRQMGADIEIIAEDFTAYLNRVNTTRDFELSILGWATALEPNGMRNVWSTNNPQNSTGFSNPRVDQLFVQAAAGPQCGNDARKVFYDEIQEIIAREAPYIFLWERATLAVVNSRIVVNPLLKTGYGYRTWEWYSTTGR